MSSELENNKALLYEPRNQYEEKKDTSYCLDLKITNIMIDRDSLRMDNTLLVKQRNIYCNIAKELYGKLTLLYHSSDNFKE